MKDYLSLMRVRQWYKNLLVFLAIFFSGNLFDSSLLLSTVIAFLSLSFISSCGYVINDLIDIKKDQIHPEKKNRPLASGKISKLNAGILTVLLFVVSLLLAWYLDFNFLGFILVIFVTTQIYSFFLKNIAFADILTIAVLFVLRAVSGAVLIRVNISPWLILCPFFLSIFLSVGKRHSDLLLMGKEAHKTRAALKFYNNHLDQALMIISTTLLVISYALYSFLSQSQNLLYTLPFALFVIFRYLALIYSGSMIARHPEKIIKDKQILIGVLIWILLTAVLIYI
jgi:4-hydroxybenzoate polyprenyltransferase